MQETIRRWIGQPGHVRLAWILWLVLFVAVSGVILVGNRKSVTGSYREGAMHWLNGQRMFGQNGQGFIYLPHCGILYIPFALLPRIPAEILWRIVTIGSLAFAVRRLAALASRQTGAELFPLMTIITLPLVWSSARNGQMTLPMTALMIISACDLADGRWWRATAWLSLGIMLKPLIVVQALLAGVLYRPMSWRLVVAAAGVLAFPFLTQSPAYVFEQYVGCITSMGSAVQLGIDTLWAQLFGMLEVFGIATPQNVQTAIRLAAAAGTLVLCWCAQQRHGSPRAEVYLYALAGCYLVLFNPRTENNGYSMIAPAIAVFSARALLIEGRMLRGALLVSAAVAVLSSYELGRLFSPREQAIWLAPLTTVFFVAFLVSQLVPATGRKVASANEEIEPLPKAA